MDEWIEVVVFFFSIDRESLLDLMTDGCGEYSADQSDMLRLCVCVCVCKLNGKLLNG